MRYCLLPGNLPFFITKGPTTRRVLLVPLLVLVLLLVVLLVLLLLLLLLLLVLLPSVSVSVPLCSARKVRLGLRRRPFESAFHPASSASFPPALASVGTAGVGERVAGG